MSRLAGSLERIGKFDESIAVLRERLAVVRRISERQPSTVPQSEMETLAQALVRMGRVDEARALTRELLARLRENAEKECCDSRAINNYAWALLTCDPADLRDVATATPLAEKAVKLTDEKESALLDTLALAYHLAGQNDKAVELQRKSLDLLPLKAGGEWMYSANLVRYLLEQGDTAAADRVVSEGVEKFRQAQGEDNPNLALGFNKAGVSLAEAGFYSMAEPMLREALALSRQILGDRHEQVAASLKNLADVYARQGKYDLAEPAYREALAMRRDLFGDDDIAVAETLQALGDTLHHGGDAPAAASTMREVLDIYHRLAADRIPAALATRRYLAQVLIELGDIDKAEPLARDALAEARALFGNQHLRAALAMKTLGRILLERGQPEEAEPLLRECAATCRRLSMSNEEKTCLAAEADGALGACLLVLKRFEEAEPLLLNAYRVIDSDGGTGQQQVKQALQRILDLYDAWGKPAEAAEWRAKQAAAHPIANGRKTVGWESQ
jgi:tetratricopeptide (TPR) repeat protein